MLAVTGNPVADPRRELLQRVLASRHFAHAELPRKILTYLCERPNDPDAPLAKEYEIAVQAIQRPPSFDPKADPIVRVSIASIRERLRAYFEGEGRSETMRLQIPKGFYRVDFVSTNEGGNDQRRGSGSALRSFWSPYLDSKRRNALVFTELLFYRDDQGNYQRNIYANDPKDSGEISRLMPGLAGGNWRPSFHFVSSGEMLGVFSLVSMFHDLGANVEIRNSRFSSWVDLQTFNLILLGSARANSFLRLLRGNEPLTIEADHIRNADPHANEAPAYRARRFLDGGLERVTEYALITRRPGPIRDSVLTLITANHGRAMEGAGLFVTREDKLAPFLERLGRNSYPEYFQVLIQVDMIDFDEEVINVEYLTHRIL